MRLVELLSVSFLLGLAPLQGIAQNDSSISHKYTFENEVGKQDWTGWSLNQEVVVSMVSPGFESNGALRFSVANSHWNTPMLNLKTPIAVDENTAICFQLKCDLDGICEINLHNSDGVEYALAFPVEKDKWTIVRKYLRNACFKRFGNGDQRANLLGDKLVSIQIASKGKDVLLDNFMVGESDTPMTESPEAPTFLADYRRNLPLRDYPVLRRNGFFPFGVISTVKTGDLDNGILFGQGKWERFEDDLLDMKRHHLNTIVNFCDDGNIAPRLELMEQYRLALIETAFSNTDLSRLPSGHESLQLVKRCSSNRQLLAWYGKDEPGSLEQMEGCLKNKAIINKLDELHPFVSVFCSSYVVKCLGPSMEVAMIDLYSISEPEVSSCALLSHGMEIKNARNVSGSKRCWFTTQTFGGRCSSQFTWRYPTAAEIRFDMYNSIACGASGLMFFIYNDTVPWLDGTMRGEEFDSTLVDAWGNGNPVYDELADFGKRVVPIMPSLLDTAESDILTVRYPRERVCLEQRANKLGHYLFFINKDMTKNFSGAAEVAMPGDCKLYDLNELAPIDAVRLNLRPGEGKIIMVALPGDYDMVRKEIMGRRLKGEYELADVELNSLKAAKMATDVLRGKLEDGMRAIERDDYSSATAALVEVNGGMLRMQRADVDFWRDKGALEEVRRQFGQINASLTRRDVIQGIDGTRNPQWLELFEQVKALSARYFQLRREWRDGGRVNSPPQLTGLIEATTVLKDRVEKRLASHK